MKRIVDRVDASTSATDPRDEEVEVAAGPVVVAGHLTIPEHPSGIVVFAHGSGSSRFSARNIFVADVLNSSGIATLLFDLLTPDEERNRANVFDIELLAHRLVDVTDWPAGQPGTAASRSATSAPARERARPSPRPPIPAVNITAVVSRGRPDLAGECLTNVRAPTLLIVGGRDETVLELNQRTGRDSCECELVCGSRPPIYSKNPARSRKSLRWPVTGSSTT
jgi:putative phosphoribosyl transferase